MSAAAIAHSSADRLDAANVELGAALGRPPRPSESIRLHPSADGRSFELTVFWPVLPYRALGGNADTPWRVPGGMEKRARRVPIADGAVLILDSAGDDAEVMRRERLWELEKVRLADDQKREQEQRVRDEIAAREKKLADQRAHEQFDGDGWPRLPIGAKILYSLAIAADDGLAGTALATELRRLAVIVEKTNTLPFPGRRYR